MGGYRGGKRLTGDCHGRLEANIVMFGRPPEAIAIVSLDTLFAGPTITQAIVDQFQFSHGLAEKRVLVLASHTHFAPMLDGTKPLLGDVNRSELFRWRDLITAAIADLASTDATYVRSGSGSTDKSVNRRFRWRWPTLVRLLGKKDDDIYTCDNLAGPRNSAISLFAFQDEAGNALAVLWSFACHPVGFPTPGTASADFVGVVRNRLRKRFGDRVPVLFAPGCMGDVRPRAPSNWKVWHRVPKIVAYGPAVTGFDRAQWNDWADGLAAEVDAIAETANRRSLDSGDFSAVASSLPLAEIFDGTGPVSALSGKVVRIPGIGRIVTLSCEPVTLIGGIFQNDPSDLVLGYEGNVFGYLPTDAMVAEGGYEAKGFLPAFGMTGHWRSGLDKRLAAFAKKLVA